MPDEILSQFTASAMTAYAIEWLKRSQYFPFITAETKTVNRVLSAIGAALTAFGIHTAIEGSSGAGWHVTIAIPSTVLLLHAVWDWAKAFVLNQAVFDGVIQKAGALAAAPAVVKP